MSKTTRELAELFGVSKQAIEKKYTPEFKAKYMSKWTCHVKLSKTTMAWNKPW